MALQSTMQMFGETLQLQTASVQAPLLSDMQLDFRTSYETLFLLAMGPRSRASTTWSRP